MSSALSGQLMSRMPSSSRPTGDQSKHVSVAVGISYTEYYLNCAHMGMSAYTATSGTLRCGAGGGLGYSLSQDCCVKSPAKL